MMRKPISATASFPRLLGCEAAVIGGEVGHGRDVIVAVLELHPCAVRLGDVRAKDLGAVRAINADASGLPPNGLLLVSEIVDVVI